ncbi:hypothetical protein PV11_08205 [Exophiala sideris]|uniref:Uncharacterized protein n=1 Tax=Exophiala sideris TaxID=1016849 RepID=A0A0D1YCL2_9EURO|nr:hypothetical protein PV11_08205 [Exophiala sideris]
MYDGAQVRLQHQERIQHIRLCIKHHERKSHGLENKGKTTKLQIRCHRWLPWLRHGVSGLSQAMGRNRDLLLKVRICCGSPGNHLPFSFNIMFMSLHGYVWGLRRVTANKLSRQRQ